MIITNENLPKCPNFSKCGKKGLVLIGDKWWCGNCFQEYINLSNRKREKIMLEELNANNN